MGRKSSLKIGKKLAPQEEEEEATRKRGKMNYLPLVLLFSIGLLTFLAYSRSLHAPLVLDDPTFINSPKLKSIGHYLSLSARSVANLSFALNYYFSGMNLVAFRITNIIFHFFSVVLVFYLTYVTLNLPSMRDKYGKSEDSRTPLLIALFAAMLFSLHPIQTSPVNYITQRMAIMAGMFSFAGIISYVRGAITADRKSIFYYAFSVLFFILAIFSKENAVMVLPALMVYDFVFLSSFRWSEFRKRFIPIAGIGIILGSAVVYYFHAGGFIVKIIMLFSNPHKPMGSYGWTGIDIRWTPVEYILTELRVISRYIFLLFVPLPSYMVFDYSSAYPVSKDLFHPITTLLSLFFIASITFFSLRYIKKLPLISFGIIWYLVTISLESFIAIGLDPYFEHRNYLPSYGLFLALASLLIYADRPGIRIKKEVIVLIIALLLSVLTFTRNGVWREGSLLWQDVVKKTPDNARAHLDLGLAYKSQGQADKAIEQYKIALNLKPRYAKAHNDMGNAYWYKGLYDKAIEQYRITLDLKPNYAEAHNNLGNAYLSQGLYGKATEQYRIALDLKPAYAEAHNNLGNSYLSKGLPDKAIEQYRIALNLKPDYAEAHNNLDLAYKSQRQSAKATELSRPAPDQKQGDAEAHYLMGNTFFKKKLMDQAIEHYQLAVRLKPDLIVAHYNLGVAFSRKGFKDQAIEQYLVVVKSDPKHAEAHENLGISYAEKGLMDKAIEHLKIAAGLNPQNPTFRNNLAKAYQMRNSGSKTKTMMRR